MSKIFDSHAHYDDQRFDEDRHALLALMPLEGVGGVINCGVDIKTSEDSLKLAEQYAYIFAACGFHPHESGKIKDGDLDKLISLLKHEKCVAVGEIGLDYHYDFSPRQEQITHFENQLKIAKELDMPVIVHNREAHEDTLRLLKKYRPKGVLHAFSGSLELAKEIIKLGMHIGLGGVVTFKNAKKILPVAEYVPSSHLLIETDAPYMTPEPFRGKRCDSRHIMYTGQKLAEIRQTSLESILEETRKNALDLFLTPKGLKL